MAQPETLTGGVPTSGVPTISAVRPAPPMRTLASKLAEVMAAVGRIPKRGYNDHFKYKFATESDVADRIRRELAERNVILIPAVTECVRHEMGKTSSGAVKALTELKMTFTFRDGDSGESITTPWLGSGIDTEDKGVPKAMTSGEKYFLLKMFLIPTGDDPDAAGPTEAVRGRKPEVASEGITTPMIKRLREMMKQHNTNVDEFKAWMDKRFGYKKAEDIRRVHYNVIERYIVEGVDVTTGEEG